MSHRVGFVVFDGVTMLDVSGPAEVLHQASQDGHPYDLVLISASGGQVTTSTGMPLSGVVTADEAGPIDTVLVAGGDRLAERPLEADLLATTRAVAAGATRVASVCTGAFVLAELGSARRAPGHHSPATCRHPRPPSSPGTRRAGRDPHPRRPFHHLSGHQRGHRPDPGPRRRRPRSRNRPPHRPRTGRLHAAAGRSIAVHRRHHPARAQRAPADPDRLRAVRPGRRPHSARHGRDGRRQHPAPDPLVPHRTGHHPRTLGRAGPARTRPAASPRRAQRHRGGPRQRIRQRRDPPPRFRPSPGHHPHRVLPTVRHDGDDPRSRGGGGPGRMTAIW